MFPCLLRDCLLFISGFLRISNFSFGLKECLTIVCARNRISSILLIPSLIAIFPLLAYWMIPSSSQQCWDISNSGQHFLGHQHHFPVVQAIPSLYSWYVMCSGLFIAVLTSEERESIGNFLDLLP